jgi:hypothetical protein
MPGWIIQGVRGEGKSLCAVGKIKEYMLRGRPVATNLNLFLDKFLPEDNAAIAYRLPDHPRLCDFQILPPAYDPKYKKEDMNGLLVLDELGTWLNARNWNDKSRLELLNWLFLSRKDHWDLILLAQDYEMIDAQVRTTLCDFLVQASRLDRQRIPYLSGIMKAVGLSGFMPRVHRYHVFYGMSLQTNPVDTWTYTGKEFYDGYDTNQKFTNGLEPLCGTLVDMRATYSYIPANYLTGHVFVGRLEQKIEALKAHFKKKPELLEGEVMAAKKGITKEQNYIKIALLAFGLVSFLAWRFFHGGFSLPVAASASLPVPAVVSSASASVPVPAVVPAVASPVVSSSAFVASPSSVSVPAAIETQTFIDYLIVHFRPRLSVSAFSPDSGFFGNIDFYDHGVLVERYPISSLHALGVSLIHREYGADLVYRGKTYIVTAWKLPVESEAVVSSGSVSDKSKI